SVLQSSCESGSNRAMVVAKRVAGDRTMLGKRLFAIVTLALLWAIPLTAQEETIRVDFPPPIYDLTGVVGVIGTVNPPNLQSYFLEQATYDLENPDAEPQWIPASLPSSSPVVDGVLATWDTTIFPDGIYQLRLRVILTS